MSALPTLLLGLAPLVQSPTPTSVERLASPATQTFPTVKDYGARGNGAHDDTAAFQRALDAVIGGNGPGACRPGGTLLVPKGNYVLRGTLHIEDVRGLRLIGAGSGASTLLWRGPAAGSGEKFEATLFDVRGARECRFEGFRIQNQSTDFDCAFAVSSAPSAGCQSIGNTWNEVLIDGGTDGVLRGFRFFADTDLADTTVQNAHHTLRQVEVRNHLDAAYSLEHVAVRNITFHDCRFYGEDRGQVGVATNRGTIGGQTNFGGSFRWYGGGGGQNVATDFDLGDVADTILISGGSFHGSARFVNSAGPSGNQWPVVVQSNVWLDDGLGNHPTTPWPPAEQMRIIHFQFRGPITMTGNHFGVPPDPVHGPQVAKPAEIIWSPGNNFGQFLFEGNYIASSKENPFTGVTGTGATAGIYPTSMRHNMRETEDYGSSTVFPLEPHVTDLSGQAAPTVGWLHTSRRLFRTGNHQPITDLLHGNVGQELRIQGSNGGRTLVNGPTLQLEGSVDLTLADGDVVTLVMFEPGVWTEVGRSLR